MTTPIAPTPTPEMVAFYEERTQAHIERVRRCLALLAEVTPFGAELLERAKVHDASKYGPEERVPYIWLTEQHRRRRVGEPFDYPPGVAEAVRRAVDHHLTSNRHHPEFHASPDDMTVVDLAEMICDWTAMAQEFDEHGRSARDWADKTLGKRLLLNAANTVLVYELIDLLDRQIDSRANA
jgi:hypothetical protein